MTILLRAVRLTLAGATAWLVLASPSAAAVQPVVVMTSYPEEVFARFEAAFEADNPDLDVQFVWRMPPDALSYLSGSESSRIDVYWSPAYRNFRALSALGRFAPVDVDRSGLPGAIGPFRLSRAREGFEAVELAGFGIAYSPAYLARHGLDVPREWTDLAAPAWRDHVLLPVPARVGFAPHLVDVILQGYGWRDGWALLSALSANARLAVAGSGFLTDALREGQVGGALTIDFFAQQAIANGAPLGFRYPSTNGYSFAQAAVLREGPNPSGAERFVRFLLSARGQSLLRDPDIRKLPIRPDAYAGSDTFNPFADPQAPSLRYDSDLGMARAAWVVALFEVAITRRHEELQRAWATLHEARRLALHSGDAAALGTLETLAIKLGELPPDARAGGDAALAALFARRKADPAAETRAQGLELAWSRWMSDNTTDVLRMLAAVRDSLAGR